MIWFFISFRSLWCPSPLCGKVFKIYHRSVNMLQCQRNVVCSCRKYSMHNPNHSTNHWQHQCQQQQRLTFMSHIQIWQLRKQLSMAPIFSLTMNKLNWWNMKHHQPIEVMKTLQEKTNCWLSHTWPILCMQTHEDSQQCECSPLFVSIHHGMGAWYSHGRLHISTKADHMAHIQNLKTWLNLPTLAYQQQVQTILPNLPNKPDEVIHVTTFNFTSQLRSLLFDSDLFFDLNNWDVNPRNPFGKYEVLLHKLLKRIDHGAAHKHHTTINRARDNWNTEAVSQRNQVT